MTSASLHVHVVIDPARDRARGIAIDVAFEAPPGVTVLFGPSGAGKSRTLAAIAGIVRPDRGHLSLGEETWFDGATGASLAIHRRRAAYVFQDLALFPHLTAADNVAYGIARTLPRAERRAKALAMLERMHVAALADRLPRTFSGGEGQRVALARAFATEPRVVLLDEPFSALDAVVKRELVREVREQLARERLPTILVTHRPEEAEELGERVVYVEAGRVIRTSAVTPGAFRSVNDGDDRDGSRRRC